MSEQPLRIGYIWQYEAGGISPVSATALHVQAVVKGFQRHGHQVRIVTYRQGQPHWSDDLVNWHLIQNSAGNDQTHVSSFERLLRGLQQRLHLPFFRWFDSYRFSQACTSVLASYDVFYERFWLLAYGGLLAAERLQKPLIYEVNGDLEEEYKLLGIRLSRPQKAVNSFITRQMFRRAARVVTVSQTLRDRTITRWKLDPAQVTAVANGADLELFTGVNQAEADQVRMQEELRTRYGFNGEPLVMFVGSFKPWHGLDLLVQAFARLATTNPKAKLVFVGDGPVRPTLEAQAEEANLASRIVFTGAVPHPQVSALLDMAQVAVVNPRLSPASLSQSPLKLFEYMAAGKAIVAPAIPNVQQVLVDRQNALLVTPDQSEALACALQELLESPVLRAKLGQAAREQALQNHSWDRTVSELEAIFYPELRLKNRG